MKQYKSAGGVLFNSDLSEVCLIYKVPRKEWLLPKGKVEEGETLVCAAKREIREETGYKDFIVLGANPVNVVSYEFKDKDGSLAKKTVYYFAVVCFSSQKEDTQFMKDEELERKWEKTEKAIELVGEEDIKQTILKAYEQVKSFTSNL
jgi:ADP-ribose pyrophosphatase YjhB (NUDIX family)